MHGTVRVLIVDDSAYMRVVLKDMLESGSGVQVIGSAKDGLEAIEMTRSLSPDVVLLDIQMPKMDGIATLQRMMKETPTRVVMLSAMDKVDDQLPLRALELGAVDFISKPSGPISIDIVHFKDQIINVIKNVAEARVEVLKNARAPLPDKKLAPVPKDAARTQSLIAVAASTGGPRALEVLFASLPRDIPTSFLIVQHLPEGFAESFAKRLDSAKGPRVVLAENGMKVENGVAYLAPSGKHMRVAWREQSFLVIKLEKGRPVNFVMPSADVLFESAAECVGENLLAIVLTGMGSDGARGAETVKKAGGKVFVQNEQSAVAFSMPKAVIQAGHADKVLPLDFIPRKIIDFLKE
jgi:two-component system chemotaxis response regulator CheB